MPEPATPAQTPASDFPAPKKAADRVFTVPERIDQYLERLRAIGPTERGRIFAETMREIRDLKNFYALRYTRVALTRYRTAVREAFGDAHPAIVYLHSFRKDMEAINTTQRAKVYAQHHELRPIDPDVFVERALGQLSALNYGQSVAALLLLTGRRTVEVCYSGEFALVPGRNDVLLFAGQAKAKGTPKPPFEIPVLADADVILESLETVRGRRIFRNEADVNSKVGKDVNDAVRRIFGDYTPQELRKAYATITYHDYESSRPTPRLSQAAYFAKILGHGPGDINTAQSYMAFYVEGEFDHAVGNLQHSAHDILLELEERRRNADERTRTFIDNDIAKAKQLAGDPPAPQVTPDDERAIATLNAVQRAFLASILAGKTTYSGTERWTVAALERRGLVTVSYDENDRLSRALLTLSSHGAEIAAILRHAQQ